MLEAMRDFNACVLAKGDAAHFSSSLPLYSRCVNTSCLLSAHEQIGTAPIASNVSRGGEIGQLPAISPPHKPPPTSRITEYDCHSADDEELAVTSARAAIRSSSPLVLRGCARAMPAIQRWLSSDYLREIDDDTFASVLEHDKRHPSGYTSRARQNLGRAREFDNLDIRLLQDLWWPSSPMAKFLHGFSEAPFARTLWVSAGGSKAGMHYDSFDNVHAVVVGRKTFRLASPASAANLYVDFPSPAKPLSPAEKRLPTWVEHEQQHREVDDPHGIHAHNNPHITPPDPDAQPTSRKSAPPGVRCPESGGYGCDGVGCFGYVGFDAQRVDLHRFPRVAEVPILEATLHAGDVLVLPAFWFHYVLHHPLNGFGKCLTVSFTNQSSKLPLMRPLAVDVMAQYAKHLPEAHDEL